MQNNFLRSLVELLVVFLILLSIFMVARIVTINNLIPDAYSSISQTEKLLYWKFSFLFDLKTLTILLAPCALGCITCSYSKTLNLIYCVFSRYFYTLAFLCSLFASVCNYYYFKTYGHTFDVMIMGLMNEGFSAVVISIWDGYPVILIILSLVLAAVVFRFVHSKYLQYSKTFIKDVNRSKPLIASLILIILIVWPVLIRGGLGEFPLRRTEVAVTTESKVNSTVANGLISFFWTVTHLNFSKTIKPVDLEKLENSARYFDLPFDPKEPMLSLKQITGSNESLEKMKPDVVFALMESMSTDMLNMDDPDKFDVYSSLRNVIKLPGMYHFNNFISEGDGTIDTLQRIIVNNGNFLDFSVSMYARQLFRTSIALPFKAAGYKTYFISAGMSTWRDLGNFVKAQGFDVFLDQNDIVQAVPDTEVSTWGVYDQYLFEMADMILKKEKTPVMIFLLSVTNHPPYKVPENYPHVPRAYAPVDKKYDNKDIYDMYDTFHYANDQLGKFVSNIVSDPARKDNTIVAFTGDHNVRGLNVYNKVQDQIMGHQVPLYIYLPEPVRKSINGFHFDSNRFASHKDIMPTLFNACLSNTEYYSLGCNLFDSPEHCPFNFAFNGTLTVSDDGLCISEDIYYSETHSYKIDKTSFRGINEINDNSKVCDIGENYSDLLSNYRAYQAAGAKQ